MRPSADSPASPVRVRSSRGGQRTFRRHNDDDDDDDVEQEGMTGADLYPTPTKSTTFESVGMDSASPGVKTVGTQDTTTMSINHVASTNRSTAFLGMSKPVMALVAFLTVGSLGAGIWGFLTIPNLYDQIEELEGQIDRLEGQVDRLEGEVDRFEDLNHALNASVAELQGINQELNATATRLEDSVDTLEEVNQDLRAENERFRQLNGALNATATALADQVDELEESIDDLEDVNAALREVSLDLQNETGRLEAQVSALDARVEELASENQRLSQLSNNLEIIVSFLNTTTEEIADTLEEVSDSLADQIVGNRQILLANLENTYTTRIDTWDCALRDTFRSEPFIQNENLAIGSPDIVDVLDFVEDRILAEYCIPRADFEDYVQRRYGLATVTINNIVQAVAVYANAVLNFYFPDPGDPGLTAQDWAAAGYNCTNLPGFVLS